MDMTQYAEMFRVPRPLIGMVHLAPLPGSPRWAGSIDDVIKRAMDDARILAEEGIDGIIVENYGDTPYAAATAHPATVAAMTIGVLAVHGVVREVDPESRIKVGVNVLRADVIAALSIAAATGASFVRTNVLTGAMVTDQGIIQGTAYEALRERRLLGAGTPIFADVMSKHAYPVGAGVVMELEARSTAYRGLADALIITGDETGAPTSADDLRRARSAVPDRPLLIGSGLDAGNMGELLPLSDGAILGTALKVDGITEAPIDRARVRDITARARALQ